MPNDHTRGNTRVCGYRLVSSIASDYARARMANHACQDQHRRPVAVLARKLRQSGGIAIDRSSRRNAMDESSCAEALVSHRARERRRSRSDYFRHAHAALLELAHNFQQTVIAGMRGGVPFARFQSAKVTVVIVQPAELQPKIANRARQFNNCAAVALLDASAIHSRIHVEEDSDPAATPLPHLLIVLGQNGNAHLWELIGYFTDPSGICAHRWISEEYVTRAAAAGYQQFQSGRAFAIADAAFDQHAKRVAQLCGLDMHAPAIRIAPQQVQGALDVGGDEFWIKEQRRSKHIIERGNAIARVPGKLTQHGFWGSHLGLDDSA